jgi:transcriptional regulator with GAF, ATPase, and Fis domain/serine/threonine protein kinase
MSQVRSKSLECPARYEPEERLGQGGAGEVWRVRDRFSGEQYALKLLAEDATDAEAASLVREATALSGLEGLGVPRVVRFGKLPSGRLYLLRELVPGQSLQAAIDAPEVEPRAMLAALTLAAEKLTRVHRAGLLHGDIKPANIVVSSDGDSTLVDLGLAEPFRDSGTAAHGLTPKYAAPELLAGGKITVRAEIHALGVTLGDILESAPRAREPLPAPELEQLERIRARATASEPERRYPSADEFAAALRGALKMTAAASAPGPAAVWPVVGIDGPSARLLRQTLELAPGRVLEVSGAAGAGKSTLLRRLAWSLGVAGRALIWIDDSLPDPSELIRSELATQPPSAELFIVVDQSERLRERAVVELTQALAHGARLVLSAAGAFHAPVEPFEVPALGEHVAAELVKSAIPSLTQRVVERLLKVSGRRPGVLRSIITRIASESVVSEDDIEALLGSSGPTSSLPEGDPLAQANALLDRGRLSDAARTLEPIAERVGVAVTVARARVAIGLGDNQRAAELLNAVQQEAEREQEHTSGRLWRLWLARAEIGTGNPEAALARLTALVDASGPVGAEAVTYQGLALCHMGQLAQAAVSLKQAVARATNAGWSRVEGLALLCLGMVCERSAELDAAREAYEQALVAAQTASDASTLSVVQSNLAVLLHRRGDVAGAMQHFEAAVDAGRRAGRRGAVRRALANLANTDLYLGRLERAQVSIDALEQERDQLSALDQAQLDGLRADLLVRSGAMRAAYEAYRKCSLAYQAQNRGLDAAEAALEGVLAAARDTASDVDQLQREIDAASAQLGDTPNHRPLLLLAQARVAHLGGHELRAREYLERGLSSARDSGQREWIWRTLDTRAELEEADGQALMAQRDREAALVVLEEIASGLPRDLREVYWNDERRRRLRASLASRHDNWSSHTPARDAGATSRLSALSETSRTPLERRLAHILEINAELLGEFDVERLTVRVIQHALEMLNAERGFVILRQPDESLTVHTSRDQRGDVVRAEFSRSIAERVIVTQKPVVSLNARKDSRMQGYASVHQLMLQAVACVPINARRGEPIGALYLETRLRPGADFERELPTLGAFADQVGLAIETARLVSENQRRANELAEANQRLEAAQDELRELLGERTQKLKLARQRLRDAHDTLYGHFGYQGLVGTSNAMRRVYSLVDRVKDTDVPVLIGGESGTGKEVAARALHRASERNAKPFLGINCGAIPEHLLESELFGHMRGAFTGADRDRKGLIREAAGGTLLLDEIGEMPPKMQAGLLRVLQERQVRPVGGTQEEPVACRFVFATHRGLRKLVEQGKFREDLYYRIVVVEIELPPLRSRVEDIPPLVDHFLGLFAARYKRERKTLTKEALRRLASYDWPGNVRQLEHVLLNAWVMGDEQEIMAEDLDLPVPLGSPELPARLELEAPAREHAVQPLMAAPRPQRQTISAHFRDEKARIAEALSACNWNRVKAAQMLGIPRRTFYRRLRQYKLQ